MSVPSTIPAPASNLAGAGQRDRADTIVGADLIVAVGDYTGGAADDMFTLSAHGLISGDHLHVLYQTVMGGVTGGVLTRGIVKVLSSSTFQLYSDSELSVAIENSADATVVFIKGRVPTYVVENTVLPYILVVDWDFTSGTVEDMGTAPATGLNGLYEGDTLKLLYKSAAGVTAGTVNTTYYAKSPTPTYFQISATNGGSVIDSTADGLAVFLKTS